MFKIFNTGNFVNITFQNTFVTILTFSAILKLHIYKTDVSVKKPVRTSHLNIQNVFLSAEYL